MESIANIVEKINNLLPKEGFWAEVVLGNTIADWFSALILFAVLLLVFKLLESLILWRLSKLAKRTKNELDDTFVRVVKTLKPPFYSFIAFYLAIKIVRVPVLFERVVEVILIVWVVWQAIIALQVVIDYAFSRKISNREDPGARSALSTLGKITKAILWVLGGLFILSNLGVNITSLVAGLGIGGVAIALALQNILGDLFSSFSIYFDKPFQVGDFIKVGDFMGTVERIGIKTTRLRALQGEEIVISNQELTSARVQNFKKLEERRVSFIVGVLYETPTQKLEAIPGIIKEIIESANLTRFDRSHFMRFDDSSLAIETVYYVLSSDYNTYMDVHQDILFKIKAAFEKEDISIAYPTSTVYQYNINLDKEDV